MAAAVAPSVAVKVGGFEDGGNTLVSAMMVCTDMPSRKLGTDKREDVRWK